MFAVGRDEKDAADNESSQVSQESNCLINLLSAV